MEEVIDHRRNETALAGEKVFITLTAGVRMKKDHGGLTRFVPFEGWLLNVGDTHKHK